jgi:flagellar biosynthesis protein FlhG
MSEATANMNIPAPLMCPNMIAVVSGKGGVGKTWLATSLCQAIAKQGVRTLLFDGDLGIANVDIQLGFTPDKDLGAVIEDRIPLAGAVTNFKEGDFDIIAGRSGSGSLASLPSQKLAELRNDLIKLASGYDKVIVDVGAGVDRSVRLMAGPAALTLVVITDEPTSLSAAYAFIKLTVKSNPSAQLGIVANMMNTTLEGQKIYDNFVNVCKSFLKYEPPLMGIIRRDPKVREAIRSQVPFMTRHPNSEAAQDLEALAGKVLSWK